MVERCATPDSLSRGGILLGTQLQSDFFDLDGTLVDIHGPLYIAARNALDHLDNARR
jgi:hypothetical protein